MLTLRPYEKDDAAYVVQWLKDEKTFRFWATDKYEKFPVTADEINMFYNRPNEHIKVFTAVDGKDIVGHITMRHIDKEKTELRFGFILVDDQKRGNGYGKKMLTLAIRYAFNVLQAKKITIGVFQNNTAAYHLYQKLGFIKTDEEKSYRFFHETWKYLILEMEDRT